MEVDEVALGREVCVGGMQLLKVEGEAFALEVGVRERCSC